MEFEKLGTQFSPLVHCRREEKRREEANGNKKRTQKKKRKENIKDVKRNDEHR